MSIHEHNRRAWDAMVKRNQRFARPATDRDFSASLAELDPQGWLGDVSGQRMLCLAAGGGRQGPIYAAAGAHVTVVDVSAAQLELDRQVAAERGLDLRAVQTSMDELTMFATAEFDLVMQPVSTCYLPEVRATYAQVARVLREGGVYVSQHKQPTSMQASTEITEAGYGILTPYYHQGPLPPVAGSLHREAGTLEFLHRWEELIGGLCQSGFVLEDLSEPQHAKPNAGRNSFGHRSQYVPPYVRLKARRVGRTQTAASPTLIL